MDQGNICPRCHSPLPAGASPAACPKCLLQRGLEPNTVGYTQPEPTRAGWEPPALADLAAGFPELDIIELIGRGGMGAVYKARERHLDRLVALKILPPEIGRDGAFAQRFTHEARAMAQLNHANIVTIHSFGQRGDLYYFLMEYVDGLSLRQLLAGGPVAAKEALAIVPQICDALQYAHDRGIVHRDIKPENILLNRSGQVKIADFGLAKLMGRPGVEGVGCAGSGPQGRVLHTGADEPCAGGEKVMGTPRYMAPEQAEHPSEVDHRADIYSLGVVFYQMLTGELPARQLEPPSRKVVIDVRLDEVVLRALERLPERRYQQASEVKTRVETIVSTAPPLAGSAAAAGANCGPVIEVTFGLPSQRQRRLLDLETGRLWDAPEFIIENVKPDMTKLGAWAALNGVDLCAEGMPWGIDLLVFPVENTQWDAPDQNLFATLAATQTHGATPAIMSTQGPLPATYGFKTREGTLGLLQVLAAADGKTTGVKLRYKLLQGATVAAGVATSSGTASIPPSQPGRSVNIDADLTCGKRHTTYHRSIPMTRIALVVDWAARLGGTFWLAWLAVRVAALTNSVLPPNPRMAAAGAMLWMIGCVLGWRLEGLAAILILLGSAAVYAAEGTAWLNVMRALPALVGVLYALSWWFHRPSPLDARPSGWRLPKIALRLGLILWIAGMAGVAALAVQPVYRAFALLSVAPPGTTSAPVERFTREAVEQAKQAQIAGMSNEDGYGLAIDRVLKYTSWGVRHSRPGMNAADELRRAIHIEPLPQTSFIRVSATSPDRYEAPVLVNAFAEAAVELADREVHAGKLAELQKLRAQRDHLIRQAAATGEDKTLLEFALDKIDMEIQSTQSALNRHDTGPLRLQAKATAPMVSGYDSLLRMLLVAVLVLGIALVLGWVCLAVCMRASQASPLSPGNGRPRADGRAEWPVPAIRAVKDPAIGLLVTAGINIGAVFVIVAIGLKLFAAPGPAGPSSYRIEPLLPIVGLGAGLFLNAILLWGALRMMQLRSRGLSITAAILAMLASPGNLLIGLPMGIWALVVLNRREVIEAFAANAARMSSAIPARPRRWRGTVVGLVVATGLMLLVRMYVLQPYRVESDAASPEIPLGSHVFVYKLAGTYQSGDIILYHRAGKNLVGRVVEGHAARDGGSILTERRGQTPEAIALADVVGKVVFNTRKAAAAAPPPATKPAEPVGPASAADGDGSSRARRTGSGSTDSDGDGLPDYQETHKYLTDPHNATTGDDGVTDSDWNKRRECTYSVRTVLRVVPPLPSLEAINDDFQDARILAKTDDYVELEVIHYPLATVAEIPGNRNWRAAGESMKEFLNPGITTNWDEQMRRDILADLKKDGIDVDNLTDKEVVEKVSTWAMRRGRALDKVFTTYYIHYPDGKPAIYPGLEAAFKREFDRDSANYNWTIDQHFDHELFGRGMYYNKTYGSCTSFAIYLTTVLRAVGIPARMVIAIPAVDFSDPLQAQLLRKGISHNQVHYEAMLGAAKSAKGFSAHTFNEVFIGGHWHRLNYNRLDQPIVDPNYLGLMTHLYTFNDLSEINLAATWGRRYALGQRDNEFATSNPYKTLSVSDRFGAHAHVENPEAVRPPRSHSEPNIATMAPGSPGFNAYTEICKVVEGHVWSRTGRPHSEPAYEEVLDSSWDIIPGDYLFLLFTLDTPERMPEKYMDLLPLPWDQVEEALTKGQVVEAQGKARGLNVVLLAAPDGKELQRLIGRSKLLRFWEPHTSTQPATQAIGQ